MSQDTNTYTVAVTIEVRVIAKDSEEALRTAENLIFRKAPFKITTSRVLALGAPDEGDHPPAQALGYTKEEVERMNRVPVGTGT